MMQMSNRFRVSSYMAMLAVWAMLFVFEMSQARAYNVTDLPNYLNDNLFGGANITAARLLIAALLIMAFLIPLTIFKVKIQIQMIMIIIVTGITTSIGWVDPGVFVIILVIIALMFAPVLASTIWGNR